MVYNANNAKEIETKLLIPDSILEGAIINIDDGTLKDFVATDKLKEWKSNELENAIELTINIPCDKVETGFLQIHKLFTYKDVDGECTFSSNSNMAKYKNKYGKLPEVGDKVKIVVNKDGFGNLKLD